MIVINQIAPISYLIGGTRLVRAVCVPVYHKKFIELRLYNQYFRISRKCIAVLFRHKLHFEYLLDLSWRNRYILCCRFVTKTGFVD